MKLNRLFTTAIAAAAALPLAASADTGTLAVKGSDTVNAKLLPRLAEAFNASGHEVTFEIEDKGSSTAFTNLIAGTADIGASSRAAKDEEVADFQEKGLELNEIVAAVDMIAVIINTDNGVEELTLEQVEGIFTGDITDWSEVGGTPGAINAYTRNEQSGTYATFQKLAMDSRDYGADTQKMEGNEAIASEVAGDPNGIGYVGKAYADKEGTTALAVDGVEFSVENTATYPVSRNLYYYTVGTPEGLAETFLTWATSSEAAAAIVDETGFIPAAQ